MTETEGIERSDCGWIGSGFGFECDVDVEYVEFVEHEVVEMTDEMTERGGEASDSDSDSDPPGC